MLRQQANQSAPQQMWRVPVELVAVSARVIQATLAGLAVVRRRPGQCLARGLMVPMVALPVVLRLRAQTVAMARLLPRMAPAHRSLAGAVAVVVQAIPMMAARVAMVRRPAAAVEVVALP